MKKRQEIDIYNPRWINILIVSNDRWMTEMLSFHLNQAGFSFLTATCEKEILKALQSNVFHVVLLDMSQDVETCFHICNQLKKFRKTPFIFINGSEKEEYIAQAFAMGCDDYLLGPLNPPLLMAKLHAGAPRYRSNISMKPPVRNGIISVGNLFVDCKSHAFRVSDRSIWLSPTEFNLLLYFYDNLENLVSYSEIYASVWNEPDLDDHRTVMVHVSNLRKKMGPSCPYLKTVRSAGYIFTQGNQ